MKILITGGTGLVGTRLTELLLQKGYEVAFLSRKANNYGGVKHYYWNVEKQEIDFSAFENVHAIIHLAGAGVADKRWTQVRKKEILGSRVLSTELLINSLKKASNKVSAIISASAIGFYGADTGSQLLEETSKTGNDFLANVTAAWEQKVDEFPDETRKVLIRIGIVLSNKGGALPTMALPVKYGLGSYLGTGNQYLSWIHIDDLCQMFIKALEDDSLNGAYNAVAPNPVTNKEFTKILAKRISRWVLPFYVPSLFMKMILGEMSIIVTGGSNVSCKKILETGFAFKYRTLERALEAIYP